MPTPLQTSRLQIDVVAMAAGINFTKAVMVPKGQTLGWAVNASGVLALYPHMREAPLGVWGKVLPNDTVLMEDDRAEVYQPVNPAALTGHRARLQHEKKIGKVQ